MILFGRSTRSAPNVAIAAAAMLIAVMLGWLAVPAPAQDDPAGGAAVTPASETGQAPADEQPDAAPPKREADPIAIAEEAQEPTTWRTALPRFWKYFGFTGVLLVLLVLLAVGWMAYFSATHRGGRFVWAGALAALLTIALLLTTRTTGSIDMALLSAVGLGLFTIVLLCRLAPVQWPIAVITIAAFAVGQWNSSRVNAIGIDDSAEMTRIRQSQEAQLREQRQGGESIAEGRMAVEMSDEDRRLLEEAAEEDEEGQAGATADPTEAGPQFEDVPLYQQGGKQERDPSRVAEGEDGGPTFDGEIGVREARALPPGDVTRANAWDVVMIAMARWAPWIGLFVVLAAYLDRFTRGAGARGPLPVSNRAFDALFPKAMVARVRADADHTVPDLLREMVNKGESFIYVGADDPMPDRERLERLMILPDAGVWDMAKVAMPADQALLRLPFVFESAWFRRLCFVIVSEGPANRITDRLVERLTMRRVTKAVARRTLNLFFDGAAIPDTERLKELTRLARRANVKVYLRPDPGLDLPDDLIDEVIEGDTATFIDRPAPPPGRKPHPTRNAAPVLPS